MNRTLNISRSYENGLASNTWSPSSYNNAYYNAFTYDAMGNILTQQRHKRDGTKIEEMSYKYQYANGKLQRNRLYHINDAVSASVDNTDIDDQGTFDPLSTNINQNNNYKYDEEGRLVRDIAEDIAKITWRVDGKVKEIQRGSDTSKRFIRFDYDAMGHRIAKHVYDNTGIVLKKSTYYILDAQGNQIAMYEHLTAAQTVQYNLIEKNIFGSARLGTKEEKTNMLTAAVSPFKYTRTLGWKKYEFSNHLGNVLAVFCDVKVPLDNNTDGTVDAYRVCLQTITDYSPFGVTLDGRTIEGDGYRYSFQGQEHDDEVKGDGNSVNYKYRKHDPRVGRFFAVDPLAKSYPYLTPYQFSSNSPLSLIELEGLEGITYLEKFTNSKGETVIKRIVEVDIHVGISKKKDLNQGFYVKNDKKFTKKSDKLLAGIKSDLEKDYNQGFKDSEAHEVVFKFNVFNYNADQYTPEQYRNALKDQNKLTIKSKNDETVIKGVILTKENLGDLTSETKESSLGYYLGSIIRVNNQMDKLGIDNRSSSCSSQLQKNIKTRV